MKNNISKYVISGVVIILILIGFVFLTQPKDSKENYSLDIGYKEHVSYMPLFIGIEKGFFEEEGLDIELSLVESTNQMLGAIVSGNLDASIGGANIPTVLSIEEKSPGSLKIFNTMEVNENTNVTCLVAGNDAGIDELSDVSGSKIATIPGTFARLWIASALDTVGLKNEDIEISELSPSLQVSALASGQVDALFTAEPACSFAVNKGVGTIVYQEPIRHFGSSLTASVMSAVLVEEYPGVSERLVRTIDKSLEFIRQNPEESLAIMVEYTGYKPELVKGMKVPQYSKSSEINEEKIQELIDKLVSLGDLDTELDADVIILK